MLSKKHRRLLREAVLKGCALLDRRNPRWFTKIDLDRFDLASGTFCICGQLDVLRHGLKLDEANLGDGSWHDGLQRLMGKRPGFHSGENYGFVAFGEKGARWGGLHSMLPQKRTAAWRFMEGIWKAEIRKRVRAAKAAV